MNTEWILELLKMMVEEPDKSRRLTIAEEIFKRMKQDYYERENL